MIYPMKRRVCIVVLGDIGHSPRMQYHVQSLLQENFDVDLVGYVQTDPIDVIKKSCLIRNITQMPELGLPKTLNYIFKTMWQVLSLFIALFSVQRPEYLMCQNPPAIPTLFVCYVYCLVMRARFIIDWHNYAHTIMALNNSPNGILVKISKKIEYFFGRKSYANFCVTKAMQEDLENNLGIQSIVLYDRPPAHFRPISLEEKHNLYRKLCQDYIEFNANLFPASKNDEILEETNFTIKYKSGKCELKKNRPGLLISSTSWTPDEDFNILLKALEEYEKSVVEDPKRYPNLVCVITGKGPLKTHFIEEIYKKKLRHVKVITPWLVIEDYPKILAASDIGVSLHWSSSGLDLPMKVVDMFGCGLPVAAVNFKSLNELVEHGKNGFVFENSTELCEILKNWFYDFPSNVTLYNIKTVFADNLTKFQQNRWDDNWKKHALPIFQ